MDSQPLSPVVIHSHARSFADAARREFELVGPMGISVPAYFLAARAIELALKCSLLLRGYTVKKLKSHEIGHDLVRALAEATSGTKPEENELVTLSRDQLDALAWINEYYVIKDLEYLTTGAKSYPPPEQLVNCAESILQQVEPRLRGWQSPAAQ